MPRYGSARGKWHRQKKPRYEEDKDETQGNSAIYCRDCRRITLRVHDCDPICQTCGKHFSPGDGCPDLCDTVCCCGCCGQSETSVFDKTESVLTSLATELSYNDPLQPPKLQITFLLKPAMNTLIDFLLSDRKLDIEFSRAPYRAVIRTVGGKDCFVNMAYETIDPMIRALEGKVVTADMLHEIRTKQVMTPSIWQDPNGGYLDFVTHIQNPDYWRPYVGQSNGPKERIPQHIRAIRNGSEDSLHYYIIKQGKGLRVANFIRLWTIPCPGKTDDTVIFVFSNFLEKAMCRAFQSLPAQTLELFFGPCPQGQYSGMGLNIMSPLLQGKELGPTIRHDTVKLLEESPDPEIRNWPSIRKSSYDTAARHREAIQSLSRVYMTENDYYAPLGQAFATNPSLREALPMQIDSNIWGSLDEELVDVDTWFKAVLAQLHQQNPASETKFANPVGTSQAPVGIILDLTPLHEYEVGDRAVNLPWGLRESGFEESNSLIWVYNLQQYLHIPGSFQVAPEYCMNMKVIRAATRRLIVGSRLRIIILCSDNAEEVALPDDASSRKVTLVLNGTSYNAWIETDQRSITRMFIRAPAPLSELWATHGRQAFQLTNIFRFVSTVTGLNIFPSFYESALSVALIVRRWQDEKNGKIPKADPNDIEPVLKVWLASKGFSSDEDLRRLEKAADGSLRFGMMILSLILPKRRRSGGSRRIPPSKTPPQRGATDPKILEKVKILLSEIGQQHQQMPDPLTEKTIDENQDCDYVSDVDERVVQEAIEIFGIPIEEPRAASTNPRILGDEELSQGVIPIPYWKNQMSLLLGQKYQGSFRHPDRCSFCIQHITIHIKIEEMPKDGFWIKAELSPVGTRHPHVWATATEDNDPGARLAFRVSVRDQNGHETMVTYPTSPTWKACFRANGLVDEIHGENYVEICKKPRRYFFMDRRNTAMLDKYPFLNAFISGAYTDNNGNPIKKTSQNSTQVPDGEQTI